MLYTAFLKIVETRVLTNFTISVVKSFIKNSFLFPLVQSSLITFWTNFAPTEHLALSAFLRTVFWTCNIKMH